MVTATGFKPVTPTSVVWYSIQLSYAAIALFCECKDRLFFLISKGYFKKSLFISAINTAYPALPPINQQ